MSNPETSRCSGLRLECGCRPDPVPSSGAMHETTVVNFGYDRYTVDVQIRIMSGSRPGASLALHDGVRHVDVIRWFAERSGQAARGLGRKWSNAVLVERPGPTVSVQLPNSLPMLRAIPSMTRLRLPTPVPVQWMW